MRPSVERIMCIWSSLWEGRVRKGFSEEVTSFCKSNEAKKAPLKGAAYVQDNICQQLCDRLLLLGVFMFTVLPFSLFLLK